MAKKLDLFPTAPDDDIEENGLDMKAPKGKTIKEMSFAPSVERKIETKGEISLNYTPAPNGITPPIDGEYFDIKRGYMFRKSTIRMLNELKAKNPDVNIYMSTIVDQAIRFYYNHTIL